MHRFIWTAPSEKNMVHEQDLIVCAIKGLTVY